MESNEIYSKNSIVTHFQNIFIIIHGVRKSMGKNMNTSSVKKSFDKIQHVFLIKTQ